MDSARASAKSDFITGVNRDGAVAADDGISPWWFIGGVLVLGIVGGGTYAALKMRKHNPIVGSAPAVQSGYAYVALAPGIDTARDVLRYVRDIPDEDWDIEMLEAPLEFEYICRRKIDGVMCRVWYSDKHGALVAQTATVG